MDDSCAAECARAARRGQSVCHFGDYTSWGNLLLGTAPIGGYVWLFVAPFGLALPVLEELRKYLVRRKR
jgi:hypothetical protein